MREVPWAWWDSEHRLWHVPYRSWEELRRRWSDIEEAARRNEPEKKRRRAEEQRGSQEQLKTAARAKERKLRRYPVPLGDLPPIDRVLMTRWGAVTFTDITGECVDEGPANSYGFDEQQAKTLVWASWRSPTSPSSWRLGPRAVRRTMTSCRAAGGWRRWSNCAPSDERRVRKRAQGQGG